jgi:hypothetical protein
MSEIVWVPEGAMKFYQSLGRRISGALKSKGRAKWRCLDTQNYRHPCNREIAAWFLLESWDELSDSDMIPVWDFNEGESGGDFELRIDTDGEDLNDETDTDKKENDTEENSKNLSDK